ncbi:MAG: hypothetical protein V1745_04175 [Patescibacteria group bacterium]
MDQQAPRSASRTILVTLCVAVVGTALVLVALNAWMTQRPGNTGGLFKDRYDEGYVKGYQDAREAMRTKGLLIDPTTDVRTMVGTVLSVGEESLVVKQLTLDASPAVDGVPDERNIIVASSTKIVRRTEKPVEVIMDELKAFDQKQLSNPDPNAEPPKPYVVETLSLSDVAANQKVTVLSDQNLRFLPDIPAKEIVVME